MESTWKGDVLLQGEEGWKHKGERPFTWGNSTILHSGSPVFLSPKCLDT